MVRTTERAHGFVTLRKIFLQLPRLDQHVVHAGLLCKLHLCLGNGVIVHNKFDDNAVLSRPASQGHQSQAGSKLFRSARRLPASPRTAAASGVECFSSSTSGIGASCTGGGRTFS